MKHLKYLQENFKEGDRVHIGLAVKGGVGYNGYVIKIEDNKIGIKSEDDPNRVMIGLVKNTMKI